MNISAADVMSFKESYCDEERLIANLLRQRLAHHFEEPILDVGSGTGIITATAFPDREVVHIDVLDYSDYQLPRKHQRHQVGFFEYIPTVCARTLLFSHLIQFLDDDIELLNGKINSLAPHKVAFVVNSNDDLMGEIIDWADDNLDAINPEVDLSNVPASYRLVDQERFTAQVKCPDFNVLARQVIYLLDANVNDVEFIKLERFLLTKLAQPYFTINQEINIYAR